MAMAFVRGYVAVSAASCLSDHLRAENLALAAVLKRARARFFSAMAHALGTAALSYQMASLEQLRQELLLQAAHAGAAGGAATAAVVQRLCGLSLIHI